MSPSGWDKAADLVDAAVAGDQQALAGLIRATQRDVWRFVAFHTTPGEADDLTQDTYLRAIAALPTFEQRSSLRTWLLVIARRVVVDHLRRRQARPRSADVPDWRTAAEQTPAGRTGAEATSHAPEMTALLAGLLPERREALMLTQLLGFTYAEAAEICGCPVGTIRSRVARARDDLIAAMAGVDRPGRRSTG